MTNGSLPRSDSIRGHGAVPYNTAMTWVDCSPADYDAGETMNEVTTYYLEMKSPSSLNEKTESNGLHVQECEIQQYQFNKFLYQFIGGPWEWTNKLSWSDEQWKAHVENRQPENMARAVQRRARWILRTPEARGRQCRNPLLWSGIQVHRTGLWGVSLIPCNKIRLGMGKNKKSLGAYLYP